MFFVISGFVVVLVLATMAMRRFKSNQFSLFEPGAVLALFVAVYGAFPVIGLSFADVSSNVNADIRLRTLASDFKDIQLVGWFYVLFLAAFLSAYIYFRRQAGGVRASRMVVSRNNLISLMLIFLAAEAAIFIGRWYYGVQSPTTYQESYLQYSDLPLFAQQVLIHVTGVVVTVKMALILALMSKRYGRLIVSLWIVIEAVLTAVNLGSRTELFVSVLVSLVGYHYLCRRIPTSLALTMGGVLVPVFLLLGAVRNFGVDDQFFASFMTTNEFTSIFLNALDILRLKREGETDVLFPTFYYADFINLIPQQLLPFEKLSLANWYVETFYPALAQAGGGFVFGVVAEAIIGFGITDILVRGFVLGMVFAWLHVWIAKSKQGLWRLTFYVWLLVWSYQVVRNTSLTLLPLFMLHFLPALVAATMLQKLLHLLFVGNRRRRNPRNAIAPSNAKSISFDGSDGGAAA